MSKMLIDFIDISTLPNVRLDIRYADDNFMGRVEGYDAPLVLDAQRWRRQTRTRFG